jgi:hypothetical protein
VSDWNDIVKKWDTSRDAGHIESDKRMEKKGTPVDMKLDSVKCPECTNEDDLKYNVIKTTEEILFMGWRIQCPKCNNIFYIPA